MLPQAGTLLGGRYRLQRCVGEGGMGAVFEAWQEDLRRTVAVKVIGLKPDDGAVSRFQREARAAAGLGNPHIVQIYDFQSPPNEPPFLVMELLSGASLSDLIKTEGPLKPERIARIARQVLDALGAAHAVGIIHRDIKPANVFVVPSVTLGEVAKVLDFGVAKLTDATTSSGSTGLIGTLAYMAPEQASGEPVDGRSDVYAVAATMYVSCTLRKPFEGDTAASILRAILANARTPLGMVRPDLDPTFVAIVERGMAFHRDHRFPTAHAMAAALEEWLAARSHAPTYGPGMPFAQARAAGQAPPVALPAAASSVSTLTGPGGMSVSAPVTAATKLTPAPSRGPGAGLVALGLGLGVGALVVGGVGFYVLTQRASQQTQSAVDAGALITEADATGSAPPKASASGSGAATPLLLASSAKPAPAKTAAKPVALQPGTKAGSACKSDADCGRLESCRGNICTCGHGSTALCGGACVNLFHSPNCGRCGVKCKASEECLGPPGDVPTKWHCAVFEAPLPLPK